MGNALKLALIVGGIGFLLKDQIAAYVRGPEPVTTPAPQPSDTAQPDPSATAAAGAAATKARLLAWAAGQPAYVANGGALNFHQWNFGYHQVRGVPGPAPEAVGQGDGMRLLTIEEYWSAMTAAGLSGLGRRAAVLPIRAPRPARTAAARAWGY